MNKKLTILTMVLVITSCSERIYKGEDAAGVYCEIRLNYPENSVAKDVSYKVLKGKKLIRSGSSKEPRFTISSVKPGTYNIIFTQEGYVNSIYENVTLKPKELLEMSIVLQYDVGPIDK